MEASSHPILSLNDSRRTDILPEMKSISGNPLSDPADSALFQKYLRGALSDLSDANATSRPFETFHPPGFTDDITSSDLMSEADFNDDAFQNDDSTLSQDDLEFSDSDRLDKEEFQSKYDDKIEENKDEDEAKRISDLQKRAEYFRLKSDKEIKELLKGLTKENLDSPTNVDIEKSLWLKFNLQTSTPDSIKNHAEGGKDLNKNQKQNDKPSSQTRFVNDKESWMHDLKKSNLKNNFEPIDKNGIKVSDKNEVKTDKKSVEKTERTGIQNLLQEEKLLNPSGNVIASSRWSVHGNLESSPQEKSNEINVKDVKLSSVKKGNSQKSDGDNANSREKESSDFLRNMQSEQWRNIQNLEKMSHIEDDKSRLTQKERFHELVKKAHVNIGENGRSTASIRMNPEILGRMTLNLQVTGNVVDAKMIVESESAKVKLQEEIELLKKEFHIQGLKLENLSISVREAREAFAGENNDQHDANELNSFEQNQNQDNHKSSEQGWFYEESDQDFSLFADSKSIERTVPLYEKCLSGSKDTNLINVSV